VRGKAQVHFLLPGGGGVGLNKRCAHGSSFPSDALFGPIFPAQGDGSGSPSPRKTGLKNVDFKREGRLRKKRQAQPGSLHPSAVKTNRFLPAARAARRIGYQGSHFCYADFGPWDASSLFSVYHDTGPLSPANAGAGVDQCGTPGCAGGRSGG
jgi:hypothetical protein